MAEDAAEQMHQVENRTQVGNTGHLSQTLVGLGFLQQPAFDAGRNNMKSQQMLSTAFTGIPQLVLPNPNVIVDAVEEDKFDSDGVVLTPPVNHNSQHIQSQSQSPFPGQF